MKRRSVKPVNKKKKRVLVVYTDIFAFINYKDDNPQYECISAYFDDPDSFRGRQFDDYVFLCEPPNKQYIVSSIIRPGLLSRRE